MTVELRLGTYVEHVTFGLGKVLSVDSEQARVYFKDPGQPNPDRRVRSFKVPTTFLSAANLAPDEELDNLPPWNDGKFARARTQLSFARAIEVFLKYFPRGLGQSQFFAQEVQYKRAAHDRYTGIRASLGAFIEAGDATAITETIDAVYGGQRAAPARTGERLNLLYQRVEEPVFFDALRHGGQSTVAYARTAVDFIEHKSADTFKRYIAALEALPRGKAGTSLAAWTTATWLPFIADPHEHFLIKPTLVQAFASSLPFEIQYRPDLNFMTYARCVAMTNRLRALLEESELNLPRRPLDLIDVQSFMWVVERYAAGD